MIGQYIARRKAEDKGFVMVLFAIIISAMVVVSGFAVDLGSWYLKASQIQRSADGAALSGAISLPDPIAAQAAASKSLALNGIVDNQNNTHVTMSVGGGNTTLTVSVINSDVPTYFTHMFMNSVTLTRASTATQGDNSPDLGSPFNVLGGGPISGNQVPKQNFWLAENGTCAPMEDGDFFNSKTDGNKVGLNDTQVDANGDFLKTSTSKHVCDWSNNNSNGITNANYNKNGYTYYIKVPPSTNKNPVSIAAYSPELNLGNLACNCKLDKSLQIGPNDKLATPLTAYHVINPAGKVMATDSFLPDDHRATWNGNTPDPNGDHWVTLYKLSQAENDAGGLWSVQVQEDNSPGWGGYYDNAFSLGAFRDNSQTGCDSRKDTTCPRVFGRGVMSVYTDSPGTNNTAEFYFAEIDPTNVGQTFTIFLWDPGEGNQGIELEDAAGKDLPFTWSASGANNPYPTQAAESASGGRYILDTSGTGPCPGKGSDPCAGLSNKWKFNDRLVTITVTLPAFYASDVQSSGDDWIRLKYDLGDSPHDRTTWGINMGTSAFSPPHLTRK